MPPPPGPAHSSSRRDPAAATSVFMANLDIHPGTRWCRPSRQRSPVQSHGGRRRAKDQATEPPADPPGRGTSAQGRGGAAGTGAAKPRRSNAQSHGAGGSVTVRPPGAFWAHGSGQDSLCLSLPSLPGQSQLLQRPVFRRDESRGVAELEPCPDKKWPLSVDVAG